MHSEFLHRDQVRTNHILASLPEIELQRLRPHLEWVEMPFGEVLYEAGKPIDYVYFPIRSLVSLVSFVSDDVQVQFGLVGYEGIVGLPALLGGCSTPSRAVVQVPDGAIRVPADILRREFERGGVLQQKILLHVQLALTQAAQNLNCQVHHQVEARFARWLLSIQDRLQTNELPLTQKHASTLMGTRRATISEVASRLQRAGMIQYRRGKIMICDRAQLEHTACQCYRVLRAEQDRLQAISEAYQAS